MTYFSNPAEIATAISAAVAVQLLILAIVALRRAEVEASLAISLAERARSLAARASSLASRAQAVAAALSVSDRS